MRRVVVGTAGHIDHGKTALVKALTGIDADRLEEEKRRGITIDLGFAHLELAVPGAGVLRLGIVDVPGHERFIRNMLAGVGGIDLVLLVVAADEGIKPQTREHFEICRLLGVEAGIAVLTKRDLVDEETLAVVRAELQDFLRGSFLDPARAPLVTVSARSGAGLDELRAALLALALKSPRRDSSALLRLPIDRVFTMKGFGTVVTGTLIAGSVAKDEEVEILPQKKMARVRGVQVHGASAERALAGERTALNLAGIPAAQLARGMVLAAGRKLEPVRRADAEVLLLASARPLRNHARVHLHAHTAETIARVAFHGIAELAPGQQAVARLQFADPLLLLPGDRFIIRQFSPLLTIGGGRVLDAFPLKQEDAEGFLAALAAPAPEDVLAARIGRRQAAGLTAAQAVRETGWKEAEVEKHAQILAASGQIVSGGGLLVSGKVFDNLKAATLAAISQFHTGRPLEPGIGKQELRARLPMHVAPEILELALVELEKGEKIELRGELVRAAGRAVVMTDQEAESSRTIEQAFRSAGLRVPALKEVLAGLRVDAARAQRLVTLLLREKTLVKLTDDLVFHREALEQLSVMLRAYKTQSPRIDVARFKELAGISRKYAIPLLEYLDRERVTRRAGDERVIL